jgi:predicted phosphodiesterase
MASTGIGGIVLLGDIVGYGGRSGVVLRYGGERLVAEGALCVRGNHDNAAAGRPRRCRRWPARAMDWTKDRLDAGQKAFLAGLPMTAMRRGTLFVHASANDPKDWNYVTSDTKATPSFRATTARVILCGHVHVPLLANCDLAGTVREQGFAPGFPFRCCQPPLAGGRGVGRPAARRGGAGGLCAARHRQGNELTFRRVPYDTAEDRGQGCAPRACPRNWPCG